MMDKTTQLFIRACKSREPRKRINSVYRRFYYCEMRPNAIAFILSSICDEYCPFTAVELINELNPSNDWKQGTEHEEYLERAISRLISKIRLTEKDKFIGLTAPLMFRKAA